MNCTWETHSPSPLEFFHGMLLEEFHKFRKKKTDGADVIISGTELNNIIANVKRQVYEKYPDMNLDKPVRKIIKEVVTGESK